MQYKFNMKNKQNTGVLYIMTTAVKGIIKIGQTADFNSRMIPLENNGYHNVTGLNKFFAIKVSEYIKKEKLLIDIFSKHQIGDSELFALDEQLVKNLLLSFEGEVIYPMDINKEEEFVEVSEERIKESEERTREANFSFYKKGLIDGDILHFKKDKNITVKVSGEREVEYNGQFLKLSPLTLQIYTEKGEPNKSKTYNGAYHFEYKGIRITDLKDIN